MSTGFEDAEGLKKSYTSRKMSVLTSHPSSSFSSLQQTPRRPSWCLEHFAGSGVDTFGAAAEIAHTGAAFGPPVGLRFGRATEEGREVEICTAVSASEMVEDRAE